MRVVTRSLVSWIAASPLSFAPLQEAILRAGETLQFALPQTQRIRLATRAGEPLTVVAESHNCDVAVVIEDASGAQIASDDDSGIETNASVVVTPADEVELYVTALSNPPSNAVIGVRAFRGALSPTPPDPEAAARAYWELSQWRARLHGNAARLELSTRELARWPADARTAEERAARDECIARIGALDAAIQQRPDEMKNDSGRREVIHTVDDALALEARGDLLIGQLMPALVRACFVVGDVRRERLALERQLALTQRIRPEHHYEVCESLNSLAVAMERTGDWERNLALLRESLRRIDEFQDPVCEFALRGRLNIGFALCDAGDHTAARKLAEEALAVASASRGEMHPATARALELSARCAMHAGDANAERELLTRVVAIREKLLPPGHLDLDRARHNLACALDEADGGQRAIALSRAQIEAIGDKLPPDHPYLLEDRWNLAKLIAESRDARAGLAEFEELTRLRTVFLDDGHPQLREMRHAHALLLLRLGELERAREVIAGMARGGLRALSTSIALAPRERRALARSMRRELGFALGVASACAPKGELDELLFEWLETRRAAMCWARPRRQTSQRDAAYRSLEARWIAARRAVGDVLANATADPRSFDAGRFQAAAAERDDLERALVEASAQWRPAITAASAARELDADALLVSFARASRTLQMPTVEKPIRSEHAYLAHLLRAGGRLERVELGSATAIDAAVEAWSKAVRTGEGARAAGEELRRLVLDPVLARAGDAKRLRICADAELTRVPFDALPLGDGFVGERFAVSNAPSLAPRADDARSARTLVCFGAPDYDAGAPAVAINAAAGARAAGPSGRFVTLRHAEAELEAVAARFRAHVAPDVRSLTGAAASEENLRAAVAGAAFVHVATHAYFDQVAAVADDTPERGRRDVRELSPLGLCGLALAGANRPANPDGSRPGVLTAEELETLDLSACELIVLAACSTQAGLASPSEGVASLQSAAHAAGARAVITTLWSTDDEVARALTLELYRGLWVDRLPLDRALWRAKMKLHAARHPPSDWAGWVLTDA